MKKETEIGTVLSQAKEHLEPPKLGEAKNGCSPRAFRGSTALHLDIGLLASRTASIKFCCFKLPSMSSSVWYS